MSSMSAADPHTLLPFSSASFILTAWLYCCRVAFPPPPHPDGGRSSGRRWWPIERHGPGCAARLSPYGRARLPSSAVRPTDPPADPTDPCIYPPYRTTDRQSLCRYFTLLLPPHPPPQLLVSSHPSPLSQPIPPPSASCSCLLQLLPVAAVQLPVATGDCGGWLPVLAV